MRRSDVLVVGAGQAGLALSACLGQAGIGHVLIERGRVAERWRSERWDSLRLLTPNWMTRLPGHRHDGPDPEGFMGRDVVVELLEGYAAAIAAPVEEGTAVLSVRPAEDGFAVETDRGAWRARAVVVAMGACDLPAVPGWAADLSPEIAQVVPGAYRNPAGLTAGGVLVVGASATGVQFAREIHASGRPVTLAVGRHIRLPRRHRGRDIMEWMDRAGILDEPWWEVPDLAAARRQPSLQLSGAADGVGLDLMRLRAMGVRLVGRAPGAGACASAPTSRPPAPRRSDGAGGCWPGSTWWRATRRGMRWPGRRPNSRQARRRRSTCVPRGSRRCSGRPGTAATTAGGRYRAWSGAARSPMPAGAPPGRGSMRSGCRSCSGAVRPSSTGWAATPRRSRR